MKKKGFSLIEVLIVLGLIGLFTSFLAPKISSYLAVGKETKVISTLDNLRTASEVYYFTTGEPLRSEEITEENGKLTVEDLQKLEDYLGSGYKKLAEGTGVITQEIGGSKATEDGEIVYGGEVNFTFKNPSDGESNGVSLWISPLSEDKIYNMQGDKWEEL